MLFNTFQRLSTPIVHLVPSPVNLELLIRNGLVRRLKGLKSGVKVNLGALLGLIMKIFTRFLTSARIDASRQRS
ncbi:MAG TPA: hypothetical protein VIW25_00840 [Nitrososphaeraceae archaeon]